MTCIYTEAKKVPCEKQLFHGEGCYWCKDERRKWNLQFNCVDESEVKK